MSLTSVVALEPLIHDVPSAQNRLGGLSRTSVYRLIAAGELEVIKIGGRTFIPEQSIRDYIDKRIAASKSPA